MLMSCRQEASPADAAFPMLSLRTILGVVACGWVGLGFGEKENPEERWR